MLVKLEREGFNKSYGVALELEVLLTFSGNLVTVVSLVKRVKRVGGSDFIKAGLKWYIFLPAISIFSSSISFLYFLTGIICMINFSLSPVSLRRKERRCRSVGS